MKMLGTKAELRKTRFYQEIQEEVLMPILPALLEAGISVSEIAKRLKMSVKRVKAVAKNCGIEV
jgi:predicted transposase YdaD